MDIHELKLEQVEELCNIAEKRAREYVLSMIPSRKISDLNISVDAEGSKPIIVDIDVDIKLSDLTESNAEKTANEAMKKAFIAVEEYLYKIENKFRDS